MSIEAMKQALGALEEVKSWKSPTRWDGCFDEEIASLRQAIANEALDKKAENARELGLDYEPAQDFVCSTGLCHYKAQQAEKQEPVAWMDGNQVAGLILSDPDGGEMRVSSDLTIEHDGAIRFTVTNPKTGRRFGIYLGITELSIEAKLKSKHT